MKYFVTNLVFVDWDFSAPIVAIEMEQVDNLSAQVPAMGRRFLVSKRAAAVVLEPVAIVTQLVAIVQWQRVSFHV